MGQFSIVFPDQDMIISVNETASNAHWAQNTLDEIWRFAKTVQEETLPEDEASSRHLKEKLSHLSLKAPHRQCSRNRKKRLK